MFRHLKYDDARAIDLLLNSGNELDQPGYAWGHVEGHMKSNSSSEPRLKGAERILQLLDTLPAPEPPSDLVARTMARIESADASTHFFAREADRAMPDLGANSMRPHA